MQIDKNKSITQEAINNNYNTYLQRLEFYKEYGLDQLKARSNIMAYVPEHISSVLEVGTGKGHLTIPLAKRAEKVITVDIDKDAQHIALLNAMYENITHNIEFICADAKTLDFADGNFELVISSFSFHHLIDPYAVIREMIRLTSNHLIITDFHTEGLDIIAQIHAVENRIHDYNKNTDFSKTGIFLEKNGLAVKKYSDKWQTIFVACKKQD